MSSNKNEDDGYQKRCIWEAISESVPWVVFWLVVGWIVTTCIKQIPTCNMPN
jgi:hypothetical protein